MAGIIGDDNIIDDYDHENAKNTMNVLVAHEKSRDEYIAIAVPTQPQVMTIRSGKSPTILEVQHF